MKAPIHSKKHFVAMAINSVMAGTINNIVLVDAVAAGGISADRHVIEGSIIKAVYIELWLLTGGQQPGSVIVTTEKIPANAPAMTITNASLLTDYDNKKNILYTTQGLVGDANTNPVPFLRQWIAIPKGKQRFGLADRFVLNISAVAEDQTFCGIAIYKEYQ